MHELLNRGTVFWKNSAISEVAKLITSPRTYTPSISDPDFEKWLTSVDEAYAPIATDQDLRIIFSELLGSDIEEVNKRYVGAFNNTSNIWIKTPSVALSWNKTTIPLVGGHNLGSKLIRLRVNPNVPVGRLRLTENNSIILYNPKDVGRIPPSLVRKLTTEANNPNLIKNLENVLREAPKKPVLLPKKLVIPDEQSILIKPGNRGLSRVHESSLSSQPSGWSLRNDFLKPNEAKSLEIANILSTRSIIVKRSPNGYFVYRSGSKQVVEARTINSLHDDVLPQFVRSVPDDGSPIPIHLRGFTPDEAKALKLTADLRQRAQQVSFGRDLPFDKNIALLNRRYNWDKAVIREVKIDRLPSGSPYAYKQTIEVEILPKISTQSSLRLRVVTFLKELPKEIAEKINAIVQRVLARTTSQPRNVNQVIFDIRKELRKELLDTDVDIQIEVGDIYITEPLRRDRHARR